MSATLVALQNSVKHLRVSAFLTLQMYTDTNFIISKISGIVVENYGLQSDSPQFTFTGHFIR